MLTRVASVQPSCRRENENGLDGEINVLDAGDSNANTRASSRGMMWHLSPRLLSVKPWPLGRVVMSGQTGGEMLKETQN